MRQLTRKTIVVVLAVASGMIAISVLVANVSRPQPPAILTFPITSNDRLLWPTQNSWIWTVTGRDPSAKGATLALTCRVAHQKFSETTRFPNIHARRISKAEADREFVLGGLSNLDPNVAALVAVQVVDLSEIGIRKDVHPLRLFLRLQVNGGSSGNSCEIEGTRLAGYDTHAEHKWVNGELHLQTLFTQSESEATICDIVVVQSE